MEELPKGWVFGRIISQKMTRKIPLKLNGKTVGLFPKLGSDNCKNGFKLGSLRTMDKE